MCPQCGQPIQWKKTDVDGWVPCDPAPVIFIRGGRKKMVKRRDLIDGCEVWSPKQQHTAKLEYAWLPHFYSCPVLKRERAEWALLKRSEEGSHGAYGARTAK